MTEHECEDQHFERIKEPTRLLAVVKRDFHAG
jgi:hypothetical protein